VHRVEIGRTPWRRVRASEPTLRIDQLLGRVRPSPPTAHLYLASQSGVKVILPRRRGIAGTFFDSPFHFHADRVDVAEGAAPSGAGERPDRLDPPTLACPTSLTALARH
jgi:hypothetical protein